jgi:L-iditol 2-dehydrogenase
MKAIVYQGRNKYEVKDVTEPEIGPREILVRVKLCGICSTDVFKADYGSAKPGAILGHEIAGEISEVGDEVTKFNKGDRVAMPPHAPCGSCHYCIRGQETLCDVYRKTKVRPGGFAEYIAVVSEMVERVVTKLHDSISYEEGTMIEPAACSYRGISRSGVTPGDTVVIMGDGPLGLLHAQAAKALGATQVIVSGHHDYRLKVAQKVGIDDTVNSKNVSIETYVKERTDGRGADLVIVAVASSETTQQAMELIRIGGKVTLIGDFRDVPQPMLEVDPKFLLRDDATLMASWGCAPYDYRAAYELIKSGRINVRDMVTHTFSMEEFSDALEMIASRQCMRVAIKI